MPKAEQIAGVNRHAEMINHAAGAHNRGGANIAPIHHGGSAGHQQHLGPRAAEPRQRIGNRDRIMAHAFHRQ